MKETNFDNVLDPLKFIDSSFTASGDYSVSVVSELVKQKTEGYGKIPWLMNETIKFAQNNQLVRLRGLIHDMPGTEPYAERFKIPSSASANEWCFGRYRDRVSIQEGVTAETEIDDAETVLKDRHIMVITLSSPSQSEFLKNETVQYAQRQWNRLVQESTSDNNEEMDVENKPKSIIVKCYEDLPAKINDVYDFVGILSLDSCAMLQPLPAMPEQTATFEFEVPWYYKEKLPTLHVISAQKLEKQCDSLRPFVISDDVPLKFNMEIRDRLLKALGYALNGDLLCTEFLLCHLISSVYGRTGAICLGNLSINICGVDANSNVVQKAWNLFHKTLMNVELIEVSINELNKAPSDDGEELLPKFVPAETRLKKGRLQLPRGAQIVIDETKLEAGKLDEHGVKKLTALEDIAQFQHMYYDFVYYQKEFDAEYNVCVFSDYKSLVKCSVIVPLIPNASVTAPTFEDVDYCQMAVFLAHIRDAVHSFDLPNDLQDVIANDFAEIRKEVGGAGFTADDLSSMIVLARWLTISLGRQQLTQDIWDKAKMMERERRARLEAFSKRSPESERAK